MELKKYFFGCKVSEIFSYAFTKNFSCPSFKKSFAAIGIKLYITIDSN
jgi:hypothetical protein